MPQADSRARVCGIVLAAGRSERMGAAKQLLPLHGKPLVQHVVDAAGASATLDEIVVVLGRDAQQVTSALRLPARGRVAVNAAYESGLASSLQMGVRAAGACDGAAILLGDEPGMTPELIDRVVDAWRGAKEPIVRPAYTRGEHGRTPGHPVVVARVAWPEIERLRGDEGVRAIIAEHGEWLRELDIDAPPPADIDTPEDYRRAGENGTTDPG